MVLRYLVPVTLVIALTGCGSVGAIGVPWKRDAQVAQQQPAMLPPPSSAPIQTTALPPPGSTGTTGLASYPPGTLPDGTYPDGTYPDGTYATGTGTAPLDGLSGQPLAPPQTSQTAMTSPSAGGGALARTDLLGGWTITASGDSCQLFMTLTSWTGGYRASTRGCSSELLKSVSAWNLQGSEVVLAGQGGAAIARLASSGTNRFDGQANGQMVSFYR